MRAARLCLSLTLCAALACRSRATAPAPAPAAPEEPPPARPDGVVLRAHLGQPRTTLDALNTALGLRHPVDLMLVASLGIDVAVVGAIDAARPLDLAVLHGTSPAWVLALTPAGASHARSMLASRYRFAPTPGLGERLEMRGGVGLSNPDSVVPCALVRVPSTVSSRVVCASSPEALTRAGRWLAFESAAHANEHNDLRAVFEAGPMRADLATALRAWGERTQQELLASASAERRLRGRAPDYGDPEALVAALAPLVGAASDSVATLDRASMELSVSPSALSLTADLAWPAGAVSPAHDDLRARRAVEPTHPLAPLLPADALAVFGDRASAASRAETLRTLTSTLVRVLGDRVPAPDAMRTELDALLAHTGDGMVMAVSRDAPTGVELTVALSQTDRGAGARSSLARLVGAPWLRGMRVGTAPTVTALREGVLLSRGADAPALAMGVRADALVMVLGRHAAATLDGTTLRAQGPASALWRDARASVVLALDVAALGIEGGGPLRLRYGPANDDTARMEVTMPPRALALLGLLGTPPR